MHAATLRSPSMRQMGRIGFVAGLTAAMATAAYDVVQLLQVVGILHFPLDEILIFGTSLCIVVPFVLEILALHYSRPIENRFWTHAGSHLHDDVRSIRHRELRHPTRDGDSREASRHGRHGSSARTDPAFASLGL